MASFGGKVTACLTFTIVLFAILYRRRTEEALKVHLDNVLRSLLKAEQKASITANKKVAVGFGACQDYFADAGTWLSAIKAADPESPVHHEEINSKKQVEEVFSYFFRHGAAAERYIANKTLFNNMVEIAKNDIRTRGAVGGNAPVMARRLQSDGFEVLLAGSMTGKLLRNIHPDIHFVGDKLEEDDVHLILEYPKGLKWGKLVAPRANRFIIHTDTNNPKLVSLNAFSEALSNYSPSLVVISGLQMMDNYPFVKGERQELLGKLSTTLAGLSPDTRIHFEMASFAEEGCLLDIVDGIVSQVDSLGMNEQELPNLHSILKNRTVTLVSDPLPRIATTLDQMRSVFQSLSDGERPLTRLHVHTLAYQAIMTKQGSAWKNTMSAAAKASLTANRYTCNSNDISVEKAKILMDDGFTTSRTNEGRRMPFDPDRPVSCWDEGDIKICLAPVLVCTDVVQTGGAGDNISSAGISLQV